VKAVKIGMLSQVSVIETIAAGLDRHAAANIVLDPVMVATSGDRLLNPDAVSALRNLLIPRAALVTPNLLEAAALLDQPVAMTEDDMLAQGQALIARGARAVLMKGGHGFGDRSTDLLVMPDGVVRLDAPRIATRNTHGTGCTLSSAVAAGLAKSFPLGQAVAEAKDYVSAAIAASDRLSVGKGHGPTHHFHAWW
jgi:hydroxymethylpyrimidine/phosphomethylpyrimidine kinase